MAFAHYALTLSGVPQRLSDVLGGAPGTVDPALDVPIRELHLWADPTNTAIVYVGGSNATVSATSHALALDPTQTSAQASRRLGPYTDCGPIHLSDFYVLGTANERLMIGVVPY